MLCAALLSYLVVAVLVTHQWGSVLSHTLIPHVELNKAYLALLVAMPGTPISPYLFFWQSAHRLEEMRDEPEGDAKAQPLKRQSPKRAKRKQATSRLDVFTGMTFSNLVMFAIIVATSCAQGRIPVGGQRPLPLPAHGWPWLKESCRPCPARTAIMPPTARGRRVRRPARSVRSGCCRPR